MSAVAPGVLEGGGAFRPEWRRQKAAAFDPWRTSTAGATVSFDLWGRTVEAYANANLSIVSGQPCPGSCGFCVARLRPASRGLAVEPPVERDDGRYFAALERCLAALRPLDPSVSVTGGEPTLDPRLPRLLRLLGARGLRKRTMTTNGAGLLNQADGKDVLETVLTTGVRHLNVSRAHPDDAANAAIMGVPEQLNLRRLALVASRCAGSPTRLRLSCVLLRSGIADLGGVRRYLAFAETLGVDNVVFRQLMHADAAAACDDPVVSFSSRARAPLDPVLLALDGAPDFAFLTLVVGYYYYVEVWRWHGIDVVFEAADLGAIERSTRQWPGLVFELVFHAGAVLASTWQHWDGVLGPR